MCVGSSTRHFFLTRIGFPDKLFFR